MSKGGPKTGHCRQVGSVKLYVGTRGTYWVGRYRRTVDGKTKEQGIRLGSPPETTEEQARAMLAEITRKTYKQSLWADNFGARNGVSANTLASRKVDRGHASPVSGVNQ